ncbi:MAG: SAM-dependent methyltransferase, partial [Gammaproteobacteria bacterium]|nr:SAM-dependent methyltransferase [Gammaproteobacteria bacterium]
IIIKPSDGSNTTWNGGIPYENEFSYFLSESDTTWHTDEVSSKRLAEQLATLPSNNFCPNYNSEINLHIAPWLASISHILQQGVILLIDYGSPRHEYYHPQRTQGTLMCHYRHHVHDDPFYYPGLQDITAHVDFTAIAQSAVEHNLTISGYTNQANFLINCGILALSQQQTLNSKQQIQQNQALTKLLQPHEMGELCKVIALTKDFADPLLGFSARNQLERL